MADAPANKPRNVTQLPDEVRDFLLEPEAVEQAEAIRQQYKLDEWVPTFLLTVAEDVTRGSYELKNLPNVIKIGLGVDDAVATSIAIDLAGQRLLPISALVGDVAGQITAWGGDLKKFDAAKSVEIQALSAEAFIKDELQEMDVSFPEPQLQSRLEYILVSFVKGVRDPEEAKAVLMRSPKVGGLGLDADSAEHIIQRINEKRQFAKVDFVPPAVVRAEATKPLIDTTPASTTGLGAPTPVQPFLEERPQEQEKKILKTIGQDAFGKADAEEIARHASLLKSQIPVASMANEVEAVARAVDVVGLSLAPELQKRFQSAVESRLKDIRDAYETQALLESPVEKGGLGLSGVQLSKTMEAIERVVEDWQKQLAQEAKKIKPAPVEPPKPLPQIEKPVLPSQTSPPKPVPPRLSSGSIPQTSADRAKVQDVKFSPRLAGPIEEIHALTLTEFRRLAKTPSDAIMKVKDKIDLVEEQLGYEKKLEAIKAWRESGVNQLYLTLTRDSLVSGRPVVVLSEERRSKGEDVLTGEELAAIGQLNAELRF